MMQANGFASMIIQKQPEFGSKNSGDVSVVKYAQKDITGYFCN